MAGIIKPVVKRLISFASLTLRAMTLGVRAAVIDDQDRIILVKHSYLPGWYLPGGGVDPGETIFQAMRRELHEETNVAVDEVPDPFGIYLNRTLSRRDHVAFFVIRNFDQPAPPKLPNAEIIDCQWFALTDLPDDTTPGTLRRIAEIKAGRRQNDEW